ncbi:MAG: hypothetical protein OIF32_00100 [Campylobacterales bacterium]|nr:hypothetical protein [Campylobacterales bacterium]
MFKVLLFSFLVILFTGCGGSSGGSGDSGSGEPTTEEMRNSKCFDSNIINDINNCTNLTDGKCQGENVLFGGTKIVGDYHFYYKEDTVSCSSFLTLGSCLGYRKTHYFNFKENGNVEYCKYQYSASSGDSTDTCNLNYGTWYLSDDNHLQIYDYRFIENEDGNSYEDLVIIDDFEYRKYYSYQSDDYSCSQSIDKDGNVISESCSGQKDSGHVVSINNENFYMGISYFSKESDGSIGYRRHDVCEYVKDEQPTNFTE